MNQTVQLCISHDTKENTVSTLTTVKKEISHKLNIKVNFYLSEIQYLTEKNYWPRKIEW